MASSGSVRSVYSHSIGEQTIEFASPGVESLFGSLGEKRDDESYDESYDERDNHKRCSQGADLGRIHRQYCGRDGFYRSLPWQPVVQVRFVSGHAFRRAASALVSMRLQALTLPTFGTPPARMCKLVQSPSTLQGNKPMRLPRCLSSPRNPIKHYLFI